MTKPRDGRYTKIDHALNGTGPAIWIIVEGSYNRISGSDAKRIADLLHRQAVWVIKEWKAGRGA